MNLPTTPDVSGRIRAEIEHAGKTQAAVAWAIDMPPTTWRRRMDNPETWRVGELDAIADVLGIERVRLTG